MVDGSARSRPKLQDVARLAGVSVGTVSLVLSGKGDHKRISEETQRRVQEAATTLHYAPSLLHQSVRRGRTNILAFYSGFRRRESDDTYMNRLSAAIEAEGGRQRHNILAYCDYHQSARETFDFLNGGFVDGLVMMGAHVTDPLTMLLRTSGLPTVMIDPAETEEILSTVRSDDEPGMAALADDLVRNGHRCVAGVVANWSDFVIAHRRYELLLRHLEARGVSSPDQRVLVQHEEPDKIMDKVLALPERPTALFAWHDRMAYGLLEECENRGIDVPGDLSIVGYDGIVWPSKTPHVVNTIVCAPEALAERAIQLLVRLIHGAPGPQCEIVTTSYASGNTLGPA